MANHEPDWPILDRTAYLIEHTCVPRAAPFYCAEAGQFFCGAGGLPAPHQPAGKQRGERTRPLLKTAKSSALRCHSSAPAA